MVKTNNIEIIKIGAHCWSRLAFKLFDTAPSQDDWVGLESSNYLSHFFVLAHYHPLVMRIMERAHFVTASNRRGEHCGWLGMANFPTATSNQIEVFS